MLSCSPAKWKRTPENVDLRVKRNFSGDQTPLCHGEAYRVNHRILSLCLHTYNCVCVCFFLLRLESDHEIFSSPARNETRTRAKTNVDGPIGFSRAKPLNAAVTHLVR